MRKMDVGKDNYIDLFLFWHYIHSIGNETNSNLPFKGLTQQQAVIRFGTFAMCNKTSSWWVIWYTH